MKQKRFRTEASIINEIARLKQQVITLTTQAELDCDEAVKVLRSCDNPKLTRDDRQHLKDTATELRTRCKKAKRSAFRIEDARLPRLKDTLAAFRTTVLPLDCMKTDPSVVLQ